MEYTELDQTEGTDIYDDDVLASTHELLPGTILKGEMFDYKIVKCIGRGTFGITYLATSKIGRVAIKEFYMHQFCNREASSQDVTGSSPGNQIEYYGKKFQQEAINLQKLDSQNVVKVYETFEAHNTFYYSMEYVEGGTLNDYIKEKGFIPEDEAISIIYNIAKAVKFVHDHQLLHLDLKPNNIMRRSDGKLLLIDFGLSKQYDENGEPESSSNIGLGTPGYAPTEQISHNGKEFAPWIDIYALGAILFKILTGNTPPNASEVLNNGVPIKELKDKNISNDTVKVVKKAMNPLWKKRYQTVTQLISDLPLGPNDKLDYCKNILHLEVSTIETLSELPEYGGDGTNDTGGREKTISQIFLIAVTCVTTALLVSSTIEWIFLDGVYELSWGVTLFFLLLLLVSIYLLKSSRKRKVLRIEFAILLTFFILLSTLQLPWDKLEITESQFSNRSSGNGEVMYSVGNEKFTMIPVKGGEFIMGGDGFESQGNQPHSVELTDNFYIGETEVTQGLWKSVMGNYSSHMVEQDDSLPADSISYEMAIEFIERLNNITGQRFRLPTEAEWEYAARGGHKMSDFSFSGSDDIREVAWFIDNSYNKSHKVATKKPNSLGLYDMTGNVEEWCQDMYVPFTYSNVKLVNPNFKDSTGTNRVARGGNYLKPDHSMTVNFHSIDNYWREPKTVGLRLAL